MSLSNPNTNELSATDGTGVQQFHMAQYKKVFLLLHLRLNHRQRREGRKRKGQVCCDSRNLRTTAKLVTLTITVLGYETMQSGN
jgi:hypothetical protein